ncbi:aldehyde dehydrogenase (NADP(+)) [Chitinasiproducens palmae]|uniref:NADP-dependent aldehyde dehydrogenase n=1 Tax=Chitinasiproducens palmae TaxID=1770053 RepID=A0A1H2PLB6_9BURK|nr:aldehyde dehydrogenase (NADP(+)) [Chitinasiproducens palmae]SDV47235.1 NADP-dependent aldehyde dehydrogenase [Chitinasiproducens palmae]
MNRDGQDDRKRIDEAATLAHAAAPRWARSTRIVRARLLEGLASALEANAAHLVEIADEETGLGTARLNGELARTAFQLRGFANEVNHGVPYRTVDDHAVAGAPPAGRPRLTRVTAPLGPVAMFSASNFPFAFSVLGGDTASALAAGCPVIVKAHSGHARLSQSVYRIAADVVVEQGLPPGLLTMIDRTSREANAYLVQHPRVAAVAFTGSYQGGVALWRAANERARPIPFYGELGSTNPLIVLPAALIDGASEKAQTLAASIASGSGQFCTQPGIICVFDGAAGDDFVGKLAAAVRAQRPHRMLTEGIRQAYEAGARTLAAHGGARALIEPAGGMDGMDGMDETDDTGNRGGPAAQLFETDTPTFLAEPALREEVFGPASVVVRVKSADQVLAVLDAVGGSLTVTVWGASEATDDNRRIVDGAERIAGRVLFAGVPTGVAVTHAQHHGGPWPASTAPQTTSVGYAAIERFLRPVALQDAPDWAIAERSGGADVAHGQTAQRTA